MTQITYTGRLLIGSKWRRVDNPLMVTKWDNLRDAEAWMNDTEELPRAIFCSRKRVDTCMELFRQHRRLAREAGDEMLARRTACA